MDERGLVRRPAGPPPAVVPDRPPMAVIPSGAVMAQIRALAEMAVQGGSEMLPRNIRTPAQAAAVILAGYELGLRPFTALRHVYIVNGRTEIETRAMVGLIRARMPGVQFAWPEYTRAAVTCEVLRPGQPKVAVRYTVADAEASGQMQRKKVWVGEGPARKRIEVDGPWQLYTRDMLYAAATKRACRLACPDVINAIEGGMAPEVLDQEEDGQAGDMTVRVVDAPPLDTLNEGDDGTLSPEVGEPHARPDARKRVRDIMKDATASTDAVSLAGKKRQIAQRYSIRARESINRLVARLTAAEVEELAADLEAWLYGVPAQETPAEITEDGGADAPVEVLQGEHGDEPA